MDKTLIPYKRATQALSVPKQVHSDTSFTGARAAKKDVFIDRQ